MPLLQAWKASPRKYSEDSRDFQLIEHLYDLALNNSKTAIDAFDPVTRTSIDSKLLNLACKTVGFDNKGDYDASVLDKVVHTFKYFVRNKGKKSTIEDAVKLLLNSQQITKDYLLLVANHNVELYLPTTTRNVRLLQELFDYILPVGYTYTIKLQDISTADYDDYLTVIDTSTYRWAPDLELGSLNYIEPLREAEQSGSDRDMEAAPSVNIETVVPSRDVEDN